MSIRTRAIMILFNSQQGMAVGGGLGKFACSK